MVKVVPQRVNAVQIPSPRRIPEAKSDNEEKKFFHPQQPVAHLPILSTDLPQVPTSTSIQDERTLEIELQQMPDGALVIHIDSNVDERTLSIEHQQMPSGTLGNPTELQNQLTHHLASISSSNSQVTNTEVSVNSSDNFFAKNCQLIYVIYDKNREPIARFVAISNIGLYFFINAAGVDSLSKLLNLTAKEANGILYPLGLINSISYSALIYKSFNNLELIPKTTFTKILSVLTVFASASFFTGGVAGATFFALPASAGIPIGILNFFVRFVFLLDSTVKMPKKIEELKAILIKSYQGGEPKEFIFLFIILLTAITFSLSKADATYAALNTLANSVGIANSYGLTIACYAGTSFGVLGLAPMPIYWGYRGLRQLFGAGEVKPDGNTDDPTDRYTYLGFIFFWLNIVSWELWFCNFSRGESARFTRNYGYCYTVSRFWYKPWV